MVDVLVLVLHYKEQAVLAVVELAPEVGVPTKMYVLNVLHRLVDGKTEPPPVNGPHALRLTNEPQANVNRYDALREEGKVRNARLSHHRAHDRAVPDVPGRGRRWPSAVVSKRPDNMGHYSANSEFGLLTIIRKASVHVDLRAFAGPTLDAAQVLACRHGVREPRLATM